MTTRTAPRTRTHLRPAGLLAALALTTGLAGAGCSADERADRAAGGLAATSEERVPPAGADDAAGAPVGQVATQPSPEPAIIATATVELAADDVAEARAEVQKVVDRAGGSITGEETASHSGDGELASARIVLRVPSARFDATKAALEEVATFVDSETVTDDVSTEVVDVAARIRSQEASVRRIEALLAQAETLGQIISIESELARRQADLDALKSRQQLLKDQTSLSTITVYLERKDDESADDETADGFLAGLAAGWDSFVSGLVVASTVLGFLVPWLGALAIVLVPALLWARSRRGKRVVTSAQP